MNDYEFKSIINELSKDSKYIQIIDEGEYIVDTTTYFTIKFTFSKFMIHLKAERLICIYKDNKLGVAILLRDLNEVSLIDLPNSNILVLKDSFPRYTRILRLYSDGESEVIRIKGVPSP